MPTNDPGDIIGLNPETLLTFNLDIVFKRVIFKQNTNKLFNYFSQSCREQSKCNKENTTINNNNEDFKSFRPKDVSQSSKRISKEKSFGNYRIKDQKLLVSKKQKLSQYFKNSKMVMNQDKLTGLKKKEKSFAEKLNKSSDNIQLK